MTDKFITPLIDLGCDYLPNSNRLWVKAEYLQPSGSAKGRCVEAMIEDYIEKNGEELTGRTVIESTSGNTGLALAHFGKQYGYKTLLVVDRECPEAKLAKLKKSGADVVVPPCPEDKDPREFRMAYVKELTEKEGYIWLNQYDNPSAPVAHVHCAEEIADVVDADYCFVSAGTGATLRGVIDGMKKCSPNTKVVGVEPEGSMSLSIAQEPGYYMNFGPGFHEVAPYLKDIKVDGVQVKDMDAVEETRKLYGQTKLEAGVSTGMCVRAALEYIKKNDIKGKNIVVVAADGIGPYLDIINA